MRLQWGHFYKGDFDKAIALKEEILRNVEQQFSLQPCVYGFSGASFTYYFLGRWDLAIEEGKQAPRIAEEYSDNSLISFALWIISIAYTGKWDLDRAIEYGDLAIQKAPTPADKLWAQMALASAWCRAGETQRGIRPWLQYSQCFKPGALETVRWVVDCFSVKGIGLPGNMTRRGRHLMRPWNWQRAVDIGIGVGWLNAYWVRSL